MFVVLVLVVVAGGTLATYLWDNDETPLVSRLAAGAAIGLAVWGLVGFGLALLSGLTGVTVLLATLAAGAPLVSLGSPRYRERVLADLRAIPADLRRAPGRALILAVMAVALLAVFEGALYVTPAGVFTSDTHNLGDLPFHVGIVTGFSQGENFPPQHPELSGARLTYPFLVDFVAAMLIRAGASLRAAFLIENSLLVLALLGILYHWALRLTRSAGAALLVPPLVLLNGGLGFWMFFRDAYLSERGVFRELGHLAHDFTILNYGDTASPLGSLRWGNAITTLLLTQRAFLMGLPLALLAWTLVWQALRDHSSAGEEAARRRARLLIAAGVVTGLMPLAHTHSFAVVIAAAACWSLLFPDGRAWRSFFLAAVVTAVPSMVWLFSGSRMAARAFLAFEVGWDHGTDNVLWFWLYNTGLAVPAVLTAFLWRGRKPVVPRRLAAFLLPFAGFLVVPNVLRLAPWIWDNIKFLFYGYVALTPLLALLLLRLWRRRAFWARPVAVGLGLSLTLAGALDVWRVFTRQQAQQIFDAPGVAFARLVIEVTPPAAVVARLPTYNHPILLTGRRSYLGYLGHLSSQGLDPNARERDIDDFYRGLPGALERLRAGGVEYAVVGPMERSAYSLNEGVFASLPQVASLDGTRLLRISGH
jgi:hypothetical protein